MLAVFPLSVMPGPDTAYIVGRSISRGRVVRLLSSLGTSADCCVHMLVVAFGLTALLTTFIMTFTITEVVGMACLIYLGNHMLLAPPGRDDTAVE